MGKQSLMTRIKALFAVTFESVSKTKKLTRPEPRINVWGMSGRQAQMQIRNLMQLKALGRLK